MPRDLPVYDALEALKIAGGNAGIAEHLLGLFRTELPPIRARLARLQDETAWDATRELAHRLAGSALYCGAPALCAACRELELQLLDGVPTDTATTCSAAAAVLAEIDRFLAATD